MGSRTDEAERRIREQRALIERKLDGLESRVGSDMSTARDRVRMHLAEFPEMVPGGHRIVEEAQQRPFTAIASALGAGVALGFMTGGGSSDDGRGESTRGGGGRSTGGLLSALGSSLLSPMQPYMEDMARQVMAGFSERQRAREPVGSSSARGSNGADSGDGR